MGMSSSQARLLTLTARMHDIEYRAQRIEAQKLQMANESRRAYEEYLDALDARKIQFKTMNNDGSITFIDATLNRLENGAIPGYDEDITSNKTFLLINHATDELYLTQPFADQFEFYDGQKLGYDGTFDDFLTEREAEKDTINTYGPDPDHPIAWEPVKNYVIDPILGNPGTTVYGISGSISPAIVPDPGAYTLSETLDGINVTVTDPENNPAQPLSFDPVSEGFNVGEATPVVTGCSVTLPSTYQSIASTTYTYNGGTSVDLFSDVIESLIDDPISTNTNMYFYTDSGNSQRVYYVDTDTDTMADKLSQIEQTMSNFNYSAPTGGSLSFTYTGGYLGVEIWDTTLMQNSDVNLSDAFTRSFTWSSDKDITLATTLNELKYSNASFDTTDTDTVPTFPIIYVDDTPYTYTSFSGMSEEQFGQQTLGDYISRIENAAGVTINVQQSGGKITSLGIDGNHRIRFENLSGTTSSQTTQNQTQVDINLDALAKNIYLASAIAGGKTADEYQYGLDNHYIDNLISQINNSRDNSGKYISDMSLARMFEDLNIALASNNTTTISQVWTKISDFIQYRSTSEYSPCCGGRMFNETEGNYNFNVDRTNPVSGNPTYNPAQEGSTEKGSIVIENGFNDIKLLIAEEVLNDKTQSPSAYLNQTGNVINSLNEYEVACLMTYHDNSTAWQAIINTLKTATNKEDLGSYITTSATGFTVSEDTTNLLYTNTRNLTETPPSNNYTTPSSFDDILDQLAYGIYNAHSSEYDNPNQVKTKLSGIFNSSGSELASISTFVNDSSAWSRILTQLYNQINGGDNIESQYTNKFEGVTVTYGEGDAIHFTEDLVGRTDTISGEIHVATDAAIISNLEAAFKHAGVTTDAASFISDKRLDQKYMINEIVCEYLLSGGTNNTRFNAMIGGEIPEGRYDGYMFYQDVSGTCKATDWEQMIVDTKEVWRKDDNYYKLLDEYNMLKKFENLTVKIIEEPLASSVDFISNFLTFDNAYIVEFDKNTHDFADTSVATNTNLQEIEDEKDLKKAEAKYEADMKRIDMKDRRYDTQLAALDNERNAVKQEMETVKTVAKDNVDRTFRLFS